MVVERRQRSSRDQPSKNQSWYDKRKNQGIKVARKGSKPPQWEKEGDSLYEEIVLDNPYRTVNQKFTFDEARRLMTEKLDFSGENGDAKDELSLTTEIIEEKQDEPPFLWGGLSVGPVWKLRLIKACYCLPTPIQVAAFDQIAREKDNLILASPTGSGKSLAYLLPLLTTRQNDERGRVWVVTPTTELAVQLQRVVANILEEDPETLSPAVQVLNSLMIDTTGQENDSPILSSLVDSSSFILAGTARAYQQLMDEVRKPIIVDKGLRKAAKDVMRNLETLVFDEADRLFETEATARIQQERKIQRDTEGATFATKPRRSGPARSLSIPLSLSLLKSIALQPRRVLQHSYTTGSEDRKSSKVRVICASATIGRTLRRQLMDALETTSMEKAASLVTADVRTKKDADRRKASLLPSTLKHAYRLCDDEDDLISAMIATLEDQLLPAPTLIFPGRAGIKSVQTELRAAGFGQIYGLEDVASSVVTSSMSSSSAASAAGGASTTTTYSDWKMTPIFVVSEKLVRGLDLSNLRYVVSLQVPSSAAGYTHLAGRTGRNGKEGIAISFCHARDAPKLVVIAETLGLTGSFQNLDPSSSGVESPPEEDSNES
jgi:superfamily II DNA/RNA helicase